MQQAQGGPSPLFQLGAAVAKLLGRALGACLATGAPPSNHTVSLELVQSPERPGLLGLRVCDDGLPLPAEQAPLDRSCAATLPGLAPLLASPLFAHSSLLVQTTGLEEVVVRRYSLQAAHGGTLAVVPAGADGKPPGSGLCGSVIEATILLQPGMYDAAAAAGRGGRGQQHLLAAVPPACLPASAEQVAGSLQQLLGMLRVLTPPVQLLMRLNGVLLQAPDGSLQPVSGSRRMDVPLGASLTGLERLRQGIAAEFQPEPPADHAAAATPNSAGPASVLDDSTLMSASEQSLPSQEPAAADGQLVPADGRTAGSGAAAAATAADEQAAAGAAAVPAGSAAPPPPLRYIGVGEAGLGCPGAAQQFRGCKWTARAGLVLQLPDHSGLREAQQAQQAQQQAVRTATSPGAPQAREPPPPDVAGGNDDDGSSGGGGGGSEGAGDPAGPSRLPVYLFRSWALELDGQSQAAKGLEKADWPNYGFQLLGRASEAEGGSDGALHVTLQCAQPLSGARLVAGVVHLAPSEYRAAAERGKPPGLSAGYEARLVRVALEGALQQLKAQCPSVLSSRRERSLGRALPLLGKALAGILLQSEADGTPPGEEDGGSVLQQACGMMGCQPGGLELCLEQLLRQTVMDAADSGAGGEGGSGSGSGRSLP